jgi:hypothetical protein
VWYLLLDYVAVLTVWYLLLDYVTVLTVWYLLLDYVKSNNKYHTVRTVL